MVASPDPDGPPLLVERLTRSTMTDVSDASGPREEEVVSTIVSNVALNTRDLYPALVLFPIRNSMQETKCTAI